MIEVSFIEIFLIVLQWLLLGFEIELCNEKFEYEELIRFVKDDDYLPKGFIERKIKDIENRKIACLIAVIILTIILVIIL